MDFTNPLKRKDFEKDLERHLVDISGGGGVIAFPSSEAVPVGLLTYHLGCLSRERPRRAIQLQ